MDLPALVLLVFVGGITPGPNNVVLMRVAALRGFSASMPAMAGILLGGSALLAAIHAGMHGIGAISSLALRCIGVAGAIYLLVLGWQLLQNAGGDAAATHRNARSDFWSLLSFQFVNPKAWMFMITLAAAGWGHGAARGLVLLLAIFLLVSLACMTVWAAGGQLVGRVLQSHRHRALFDVGMGLVLIACAARLFFQFGFNK